MAGIDLLTGKVHALVRDRHRSREFIEFLKLLDAAYPASTAIKLILDNHSAHISKETRTWLATRPVGRPSRCGLEQGSWAGSGAIRRSFHLALRFSSRYTACGSRTARSNAFSQAGCLWRGYAQDAELLGRQLPEGHSRRYRSGRPRSITVCHESETAPRCRPKRGASLHRFGTSSGPPDRSHCRASGSGVTPPSIRPACRSGGPI